MPHKPIAEHNAELAEFSRQLFPPDPGKKIRVFAWQKEGNAWVCVPPELAALAIARSGFLNYDDKLEIVIDRTINPEIDVVLRRRDMSDAEFAALPVG